MADKPIRPGGSLTARERQTIVGGLLVVLGALAGSRWIGPRWVAHQLRSADIARDRARLADLEGLVASRDTLAQRAAAFERELAASPRRLLHAATPALGGNALQQYLESAVDGAGMMVDRVDIPPGLEAAPTGGLQRVSAQLAVIGDVQGLATLLATLERGPRVVTVERLAVRRNSALRGATDVLQVTLVVGASLQIDGAAQ